MQHISDEKLKQLCNGTLSLEEQMDLLTHIGSCEYCADRFAQMNEELTLIQAPENLKESILHEADSIPVQFQVKQKILSKRLQLLFYSAKVATAVVCSIMILFAASAGMENPIPRQNSASAKGNQTSAVTKTMQKLNNQSSHLVDMLNQISNKIMIRED